MNEIKDFLRRLGRAKVVAEETGIPVSRIYAWAWRGEVPYKDRPILAAYARKRGVEIPAEIAAYAPTQTEPG